MDWDEMAQGGEEGAETLCVSTSVRLSSASIFSCTAVERGKIKFSLTFHSIRCYKGLLVYSWIFRIYEPNLLAQLSPCLLQLDNFFISCNFSIGMGF